MSEGREEALKLVNITKAYQMGEQTIEVLKNVNLTVKRGELLVVMGPSGSGKSTLLNIAGTLDRPTSGKVYIGGVDVTSLSEEELSIFRCRHIGFVFQSYNLLRNFTARENIMIPMLLSGIYNV
ncbi:MAG: ABC transporter ATP-binding protein, partial [Thermoprotei archaeon]